MSDASPQADEFRIRVSARIEVMVRHGGRDQRDASCSNSLPVMSSGRPGSLRQPCWGSALGTATFFAQVNLVHGDSGLRKTARHAMHYLSPADAFLVVATLGTAVLIEIAAFILMGLI
ncbi:hypothetical protein LJR220_003614 [Bradyrhizobium sp. LjRoot220]|uniref:hypothetical protein n=1 Tax=Bradyrhizobium sp. LjRoot220 TaxID=3342284 RepID=UPI003ECEB3A7